ncbi:MAG TPA: hypothetical protein VEL47_00795 [Myxococcota bacterium]|nr:hypothetical protein [Myxococcota bacterium]
MVAKYFMVIALAVAYNTICRADHVFDPYAISFKSSNWFLVEGPQKGEHYIDVTYHGATAFRILSCEIAPFFELLNRAIKSGKSLICSEFQDGFFDDKEEIENSFYIAKSIVLEPKDIVLTRKSLLNKKSRVKFGQFQDIATGSMVYQTLQAMISAASEQEKYIKLSLHALNQNPKDLPQSVRVVDKPR